MGDDDQLPDATAPTRERSDEGDHPLALSWAVEAENWSQVAGVIEEDWPRLFMKHQDALRQAYAATPPGAFEHHPSARAVREMLFPVAPAVPGKPLAELPEDLADVRALASGPEVLDVLRSALACMVAMRLREEWERSRDQAVRLATVLEVAQRQRFDEVAARIPGTELQIGLSHLLAGDPVTALRHCRRAHQNSDLDEIGHVERDAAGKIALIYAIRGDVSDAVRWLERSDDAQADHTDFNHHIESSRLSARALIAVARLDRTEAERVRNEMDHGLIEEELWAIRLHSLARVGLLLGDVIGVRRLVDESNASLPYARRPAPPIGDLLLADVVDLSMAAGDHGRAAAALSEATWDVPVVDIAQARLHLLTGDADATVARAERALASPLVSARVEVEGLVLAAVAHEQLGRRDAAAANFRSAVTRSRASGSRAGFAMVPGHRLASLADTVDLPLHDMPELFPPELSVIEVTPREHAVLRHLAAGRQLSEIASVDFVSINTVKTQVRSIYRKLGASGRDEAVLLARRAGLV